MEIDISSLSDYSSKVFWHYTSPQILSNFNLLLHELIKKWTIQNKYWGIMTKYVELECDAT